MVTRRKICINNILQGGIPCKNPKIQFEALSDCVSLVCIVDNCVEVEVEEGCVNPCFRLVIDCEDCHQCPPEIRTICFCNNSDDCPICEECIDGICQDLCPDKKCDPTTETCVDCITSVDCECDQECINGECTCAPGKLINSKGCCVDCIDNTQCPPCTICVGGACLAINCGSGVCNPANNNCVQCLSSGDCTALNTCCVNNQCVCCPGYYYNPSTGTCEEIPECTLDQDCPDCFICVGGNCSPLICPLGFVCIDGECKKECDCLIKDCPGNTVCYDHYSGNCYCDTCVGSCVNNFNCSPGCACVGGNCVKNICEGTCNDGRDCGPGCGCFNGKCYPCTSFECLGNNICDLVDGCQCTNNTCVDSNCVGPCTVMGDCGPGCGCKNGMCVPCNSFNCNDCDTVEGCGCENGVDCEDIKQKCHLNGVTLGLELIPASGGTEVSPGKPPLSPTSSVSSLDIVAFSTGGGFYRDHQFTLSAGLSGTFYYSASAGSKEFKANGSSFTFKLSTISSPPNLYGFYIMWEEAGAHPKRKITWKVTFNQVGSLQDPNTWLVEVVSNSGTNPVISGGSASYYRLCVSSSRFTLTTETRNVSSNGILANFTKNPSDPGRCVRMNLGGCGDWKGQIKAMCGGQAFWFDIPLIEIDQACCDPTDPSCVSIGQPCSEIIEGDPIILKFFTLYEGVGVVMPAPNSVSFEEIYNWGNLCWTTDGDVNIDQNRNTFVDISYGIAGCIYLGYACTLRSGKCQTRKGQVCIDLCNEELKVFIKQTGVNTFQGIPMTNENIVIIQWLWAVIGGDILSGQGTSEISTDPAVGITVELTIQIADCNQPTAFATITLENPGCTLVNACNYNPDATLNDGSCIIFNWGVTYNCSTGLQITNSVIPAGHSFQLYQGVLMTPVSNGAAVTPGGKVYYGNLVHDATNTLVCQSSVNIEIPLCQECILGDCVSVVDNKKIGSVPSTECDPLSCICTEDNCYLFPVVNHDVNGVTAPTTLVIDNTSYALVIANPGSAASIKEAVEGVLTAAGVQCFTVTITSDTTVEICTIFWVDICMSSVLNSMSYGAGDPIPYASYPQTIENWGDLCNQDV